MYLETVAWEIEMPSFSTSPCTRPTFRTSSSAFRSNSATDSFVTLVHVDRDSEQIENLLLEIREDWFKSLNDAIIFEQIMTFELGKKPQDLLRSRALAASFLGIEW